MENKAYSEKLPSLEYRRKRADVIQTYKIMNNIEIDRIDGKKFFKPCRPAKKSGLEDIQRELKNSMQEPRQAQWPMHSAKEWRMTGMHCQIRCCRYEWQHKPIQGKTREMVEK